MAMEAERIVGVFKIGRRDHMEALREGAVYMNDLGHFPKTDDLARRDKHEGEDFRWHWRQDEDKPTLQMDVYSLGEVLGVSSRDPEALGVNVFCMCALRAGAAGIDPLNRKFGDTFVAFLDFDEFWRRADAAAVKAGYTLEVGPMQYVDSTYRGKMGIFAKGSDNSFESELRMVLRPGTGSPYTLKVGDLRDITMIGALDDLMIRIDSGRMSIGVSTDAVQNHHPARFPHPQKSANLG